MSQGVHLRKYGVATNINFDLFEVDGINFRINAVSAAGDLKIMKDKTTELRRIQARLRLLMRGKDTPKP